MTKSIIWKAYQPSYSSRTTELLPTEESTNPTDITIYPPEQIKKSNLVSREHLFIIYPFASINERMGILKKFYCHKNQQIRDSPVRHFLGLFGGCGIAPKFFIRNI